MAPSNRRRLRNHCAILVATLASVCAAEAAAQPLWHVDSATIRFEIRNAGLPVHGSFSGLQAEARFDPAFPAQGVISASVDAATIETGIGLRDKHLRKRGYLDVERYPLIRMESLRIERSNRPGSYRGTFALDIKDRRREVVVPFTFRLDEGTGSFEATFTIDRLDFDIGQPSLILSDTVTIQMQVAASRARN